MVAAFILKRCPHQLALRRTLTTTSNAGAAHLQPSPQKDHNHHNSIFSAKPKLAPLRSQRSPAATTLPNITRPTGKYEVPASTTTLQFRPGGTTDAPLATVAYNSQAIYIYDDAMAARKISPIPLRESCICHLCKDKSSGQKQYTSVEIPTNISIANVKVAQNGLAITFNNDIQRYADASHESLLSWETINTLLERIEPARTSPVWPATAFERTGVEFWDKDSLSKQIRKIDYDEFMQGNEAMWEAIVDICRLGLVFLKNVPRDETSVERITQRVANIRETFYGRTWDVRAKPDAENVAYTSGYLGLHQDLLYLHDPPMIQVLHCMENSCAGGESLFSDGERVARILLSLAANEGDTSSLTQDPVPYEYTKHGYSYRQFRPLVQTTAAGEFVHVFWSPPFQGRHESLDSDLKQWLVEAKAFHSLINDESAMWQGKMQPGDCVIFNNMRIMHGRTAFDAAGGSRWLKGTYISGDDFLSKACHVPAEIIKKHQGDELWDTRAASRELESSVWYTEAKEKRDALMSSLRK
ncbi:hypothetical protein VHEMI05605 [[Torrubiella] hemipterigena]|uniref:TauD/TfdA-like domain-containing protein n=1 Tax=[Torrubiella] hemipterigena TaxID=1531966 RepID=A0A0A1T4P7_9HYPO|nr:hypothetical protein VHEMI05605 [[Torrubiella] hemipterigena]